MKQSIKVVVLTGLGRSGSTILGNLLGGVSGFACIGESVQFWKKTTVPGWLCGCGETLGACPIWSEVIDRVSAPGRTVDPSTGRNLEHAIRSHRVPFLLAPGGATRLLDVATRDDLATLFRTLRSATGSRVLVDTSKIPSYGRLLSTLPEIDLYTLHIVRDPRAVAFSWQRGARHRTLDGERRVARLGPIRSALRWNVANIEAEVLYRQPTTDGALLRLRYEDFIAEPKETLTRVLDWLGESGATVPIEGRVANLGINHAVAGNPNRHAGSNVELREDREWVERMSRYDRTLVAGLTAPLRLRYGYGR